MLFGVGYEFLFVYRMLCDIVVFRVVFRDRGFLALERVDFEGSFRFVFACRGFFFLESVVLRFVFLLYFLNFKEIYVFVFINKLIEV